MLDIIKSFITHQKIKRRKVIPNAMIFVEKTKLRVFRRIRPCFIPDDSYPRDYGGMELHVLKLKRETLLGDFVDDGVEGRKQFQLNKQAFTPLFAPRVDGESNQSPTDLYIALHCAEEVDEVYGMSLPLTEKIKLGIFVGLIIAILIVIFLIVSASGGA